MSLRQFNSGTGYTLADLDLDVSRLSGSGGADYPCLNWQLKMCLHAQKRPLIDYAFRSAMAQLYFTNGPKIADARPYPINRVIYGFQQHWGDEYLNFEFPLDARRIEAIERHRQGGSLQFRLDIQIEFDECSAIPARDAESKRPAYWGLRTHPQNDVAGDIQIAQNRLG